MFAILTSAVAAMMRWLVSAGGVKMILVVVVGWLMSAVVGLILPLIPGTGFIQTFVSSIPDGISWFLLKFRVQLGIPIVFGGYAVRFMIRRIPVLG